jgi:hypothetical protein
VNEDSTVKVETRIHRHEFGVQGESRQPSESMIGSSAAWLNPTGVDSVVRAQSVMQ